MKAPDAESWWSDTVGDADVVAVVAAAVGPVVPPAGLAVVAGEADVVDNAAAPVVVEGSATDETVVDSPGPAFTAPGFLSCEQAADATSASTSGRITQNRRVIDGHHRRPA